MVRALAHAVVRRYPAAWRERYEAEVRGLIDDTPVQFRDLGEMVRGLFTERVRELLMSDEKPRRAALVVGLATPIAGLLCAGLAWLAGRGIVRLTGPWSDASAYVGLAVFCVLIMAILVLAIRGRNRRDPNRPFVVAPDVAVRMLPLSFVAACVYAALMAQAEPTPSRILPSWVGYSANWMYFALFAGSQIASFLPGQQLLETFGRIAGAEAAIRMNEQWVASCHDWIAKGVPSPLNDALEQVAKATAERDRARARLQELGYRARFRGPLGHHVEQGTTT